METARVPNHAGDRQESKLRQHNRLQDAVPRTLLSNHIQVPNIKGSP